MSTNIDSAVSLLRMQFNEAHGFLAGTLEGITSQQAHWTPPGMANPLGATYAHVAVSEDGTIIALIKGGAPLFATSWEGKVGVSELPPMPAPGGNGLPSWSAWGRKVQIDWPALQQYGQTVFANTDEYLATLNDSDLNRPLDLSALGLGQHTVGSLLTTMIANVNWHCGEIACLKGLQGVRGYPI